MLIFLLSFTCNLDVSLRSNCLFHLVLGKGCVILLAHLSRRLIGELIVYGDSRCPASVNPSIVNIFK